MHTSVLAIIQATLLRLLHKRMFLFDQAVNGVQQFTIIHSYPHFLLVFVLFTQVSSPGWFGLACCWREEITGLLWITGHTFRGAKFSGWNCEPVGFVFHGYAKQ